MKTQEALLALQKRLEEMTEQIAVNERLVAEVEERRKKLVGLQRRLAKLNKDKQELEGGAEAKGSIARLNAKKTAHEPKQNTQTWLDKLQYFKEQLDQPEEAGIIINFDHITPNWGDMGIEDKDNILQQEWEAFETLQKKPLVSEEAGFWAKGIAWVKGYVVTPESTQKLRDYKIRLKSMVNDKRADLELQVEAYNSICSKLSAKEKTLGELPANIAETQRQIAEINEQETLLSQARERLASLQQEKETLEREIDELGAQLKEQARQEEEQSQLAEVQEQQQSSETVDPDPTAVASEPANVESTSVTPEADGLPSVTSMSQPAVHSVAVVTPEPVNAESTSVTSEVESVSSVTSTSQSAVDSVAVVTPEGDSVSSVTSTSTAVEDVVVETSSSARVEIAEDKARLIALVCGDSLVSTSSFDVPCMPSTNPAPTPDAPDKLSQLLAPAAEPSASVKPATKTSLNGGEKRAKMSASTSGRQSLPASFRQSASLTSLLDADSSHDLPKAASTATVVADSSPAQQPPAVPVPAPVEDVLPSAPPRKAPALTVADVKACMKATVVTYLQRNPQSDTYQSPSKESSKSKKPACGVKVTKLFASHGKDGITRANKLNRDLDNTNDCSGMIELIRALFNGSAGDWKDPNSLKRMVCDDLYKKMHGGVNMSASVKRSKQTALTVVLAELETGWQAAIEQKSSTSASASKQI